MSILTLPVMGINGKYYSYNLMLESHPVSKACYKKTCKYTVNKEKFNLN